MTYEQATCRHSEVFSGDLAWCSYCELDLINDPVLILPIPPEELWISHSE